MRIETTYWPTYEALVFCQEADYFELQDLMLLPFDGTEGQRLVKIADLNSRMKRRADKIARMNKLAEAIIKHANLPDLIALPKHVLPTGDDTLWSYEYDGGQYANVE